MAKCDTGREARQEQGAAKEIDALVNRDKKWFVFLTWAHRERLVPGGGDGANDDRQSSAGAVVHGVQPADQRYGEDLAHRWRLNGARLGRVAV
jgi:hypothetical protein